MTRPASSRMEASSTSQHIGAEQGDTDFLGADLGQTQFTAGHAEECRGPESPANEGEQAGATPGHGVSHFFS